MGMTPYGYCAGNPVKLVDVDGLYSSEDEANAALSSCFAMDGNVIQCSKNSWCIQETKDGVPTGYYLRGPNDFIRVNPNSEEGEKTLNNWMNPTPVRETSPLGFLFKPDGFSLIPDGFSISAGVDGVCVLGGGASAEVGYVGFGSVEDGGCFYSLSARSEAGLDITPLSINLNFIYFDGDPSMATKTSYACQGDSWVVNVGFGHIGISFTRSLNGRWNTFSIGYQSEGKFPFSLSAGYQTSVTTTK